MTTPRTDQQAVFRPDDAGYADAARTLTGAGSPDLVVRPRTAEETAAAVWLARAEGLALTVRSGGHSMAGLSRADGGLLLDLREMAAIEVDPVTRTVRIGGGATWGMVAMALRPYGLGITAGDTASVGVGGLTLGGGIGWMVRRYGLAIDNLVGAQLVTGAGDILELSTEEHPDLFWSVRGGGAGSGVVTRFDFRAQPVTDVVFGTIMIEPDDPARLIDAWHGAQCDADERLTTVLSLMPGMGGRPPAAMVQLCFDGSQAEAQPHLDRLLALGPVNGRDVGVHAYADVLEDAHQPPGVRVSVANTFLDLDRPAVAALAELYAGGNTVVSLRALGGAVARVPAGATAFAHRTGEVMALALRFLSEGDDATLPTPAWRAVAVHGSGTYLNFQSAADPSTLAAAYPPATRERLARIRAEHDPDGLLGAPAPVATAGRTTDRPGTTAERPAG